MATNFPIEKRCIKSSRPRSISPIPIVLGSVDATKIPTDSYASIFPREPTLKPSATLKFDRPKTSSTIGPEKDWDFEHQTRCFNPKKPKH